MNLQTELPLRTPNKAGVHMVVETPAGSAIKYAYDHEIESFVWSRPLIAGLTFPYDFGFLPQTLGDDGDALDAMLLTDQGSRPGIVVPSRVIGALRVEQFRDGAPAKRNDRIMLLPSNDHRNAHILDVGNLQSRLRDELEAFFVASLSLTGKKTEFRGWADAAEARAWIDQAAERFSTLGV